MLGRAEWLRKVFTTLLALALLCAASSAFARRITDRLRRALALVEAQASPDEARALGKLFALQGYQQVPLARGFVSGAIGRDPVAFLDRQIATLEGLRAHRPWLTQVIDELKDARGQLERHGYLNWGPANSSHPSDRLVLDGYRFDAVSFRKNARALRGAAVDQSVQQLRAHYEGLGLKVELRPFSSAGQVGHNLVVTLPGRSKQAILLGASQAAGDASGPAALMEAARALKGQDLGKTIKLVHFAGQDPSASRDARQALAEQLKTSGEPIEAVLLLDAIGQVGQDKLQLHTDRNERALYLGSEIARAAARQGGLKTRGRLSSDGQAAALHAGDAAPFARQGIPTVSLGDRRLPGRPGGAGSSRALDVRQAGRIVSATVEAVARLAQPVEAAAELRLADLAEGSTLGAKYRALPGGKPPADTRDELLDEHGRIRPAYQAVARALATTPKERSDRTARAMNADSRDQTLFRAYPRVITSGEFDEIKRGMGQIERVFQAALHDLYSPRSRLVAAGIVGAEELANSEGFDPSLVGRLGRKSKFDFLIRPDLVRDEQGRWTLLEVNQGYVGGLPGMPRIREILKNQNPRVFDAARIQPTEDFVSDLARNLRSLARGKAKPKVVFWNYGKQQYWGDREDQYLRDELKKQGVEFVSDDTNKQLVTVRGRVYLQDKDGSRERVDVVYSRKGWQPAEMEEAHLKGQVAIFPSPGSAVLESKNLYKKLPQLVRTLLKEEPVFKFLETRSFAAKGGKLDGKFLDEVMRDPGKWVLKSANGAQGDGVLVGKDATPQELAVFKARILKSPGGWDAQMFVSPATLNGERVDLDPYLISMRGKYLIPANAMVRTAKLNQKFGDDPRFLDTWVLDESRPRDVLAERRGLKARAQAKGRPSLQSAAAKGRGASLRPASPETRSRSLRPLGAPARPLRVPARSQSPAPRARAPRAG